MRKAIKLITKVFDEEYAFGSQKVERPNSSESRAEELLPYILEAIREDGEAGKENEVRGLGIWCGVNLDYLEAESKSSEVNLDLKYKGSGETLYNILVRRGWTPPLK